MHAEAQTCEAAAGPNDDGQAIPIRALPIDHTLGLVEKGRPLLDVIAQATNIQLTLQQELTLLLVLLVTSKGAAGVTGSGFVTLAATLSTIGTIPVSGLALLLGANRLLSEARALTYLIGNGVATLIVG